ncbi:MAG: DUF4335 domain-containing protein [Vulcanococcus sp.]|jgi:hypothetical protein
MKLSTRYEQTSCRLVLEGLPDLSAGQTSGTLGILTGFTLALAGRTELEGRREHLQALISVVLPYARHLLSGQSRAFGRDDDPVAIQPDQGAHRLELRSSQPDTPPLVLSLDDAELTDLVRTLDQLRLDGRVAVPFSWASHQPLRRRDQRRRVPLRRRLAAPVAGIGAALVAAALVALIPPTPRANRADKPVAKPSVPEAPAPQAR